MFNRVARTLFAYLSGESASQLPALQAPPQALAEIQAVFNVPARDGGVTYSLYFGDQWSQPFYAVGLDNNFTWTAEPDALADALPGYLRTHRELLAHPRCCVGIWRTKDVDDVITIWIDIAVLVYNETRAREFALAGNQIALYDLRRNGAGEIIIGGTGESSLQRLRRLDAQDKLEPGSEL